VSRLPTKCGILDVSKPYRAPQSVTWITLIFLLFTFIIKGTRGSSLVEALCYKPEGRRFDSR
jgi:hypothetical protein